MTRSRAVSLWLPVVAWAALIFVLSSIPHLSTGLGVWDLILRKLAHATEYGILGALLVRALGRPVPAALVAIAYAASDELHQHFVNGRHATPLDVAIDAAGVLLGIAIYRRTRQYHPGPWSETPSTTGSSTRSSSDSTR
jgi:VanZ family protein